MSQVIPINDQARAGLEQPSRWQADRSAYAKLGKDLLAGLEATFRFVFVLLASPILIVLMPLRRLWVVKMTANIMSFARLVVAPVVILGYFLPSILQQGDITKWTTWVVGIALLDGIDGPCARYLDAETDLGKILDPLADKIMMVCLVLAYVIGTIHETGWLLVPPLLVVIVWVFHVELNLVKVSTKLIAPMVLRMEVAHPGANVWGKIKFNVQMAAFLVGFMFLIHDPTNQFGPVTTVVLLGIARWLADKSLTRHRWEYIWLVVLSQINPPAPQVDVQFPIRLALATRFPLERFGRVA
ncbi:CDP-alcohol phosphatidyltransferase family protein [Candidatus Saccharibacteria bacterium]|nr:CDP-alcohol phosphatidyltransferase family protein [Candidatus Saccharibacteria bacterium]